MAEKALPSPDVLRQLIRYDRETGKVYWRTRSAKFFTNEGQCKRWNTRFAGKECFKADSHGYGRGCVLSCHISAHRLVWALEYGEWPVGHIDHIDGNRRNNRMDNLRVVNAAENQRNRALPNTNSTGVMGCHWVPSKGMYRVNIGVDRELRYIGFFKNLRDAAIARTAAERALGFHNNHGRKAHRDTRKGD